MHEAAVRVCRKRSGPDPVVVNLRNGDIIFQPFGIRDVEGSFGNREETRPGYGDRVSNGDVRFDRLSPFRVRAVAADSGLRISEIWIFGLREPSEIWWICN